MCPKANFLRCHYTYFVFFCFGSFVSFEVAPLLCGFIEVSRRSIGECVNDMCAIGFLMTVQMSQSDGLVLVETAGNIL